MPHITGKFINGSCPNTTRTRLLGGGTSSALAGVPNTKWRISLDSGLGPVESPWPNPDQLQYIPGSIFRLLFGGIQKIGLIDCLYVITRGQVPNGGGTGGTYLCVTAATITGATSAGAFTLTISNPVRNAANQLEYDFDLNADWTMLGGDPGDVEPPIVHH